MGTIHYLNRFGPKKFWSKNVNNPSKGQIKVKQIILHNHIKDFLGLRPELLEKHDI